MDEEKTEEKNEAPSASEEEKKDEIVNPETPPSQDDDKVDDDPVKKELEKVGKKKFTKRERLNFEKKKIDEQLGVIDKDEGIEPPIDATDETPVTVGMLKEREKSQSQKTAVNLAEEIEDEDERELTKHYLQNRIISSGNPNEDLRFARAAVNSLKNAQIAEETDRKRTPKGKGTPPGAPGTVEKQFKPTEEESVFMNPPYNLTKEDVIKARQEKENNQQ